MKHDRRETKSDDPDQSKAFVETARKLGADQASSADELMGHLAKRPPEPKKSAVKKRKKSK